MFRAGIHDGFEQRCGNSETQFLVVIDNDEVTESQNTTVGSVFAKGKHAVDLDIITRLLALDRNLPSNFIWEEFCK